MLTDLGDAGPSLRILADDHAVADRLAVLEDIVKVARVSIDEDRARRFLAVILHDGPLIGGWNARLRIRCVGQKLFVARGEVGVGRRFQCRLQHPPSKSPVSRHAIWRNAMADLSYVVQRANTIDFDS
jgi:hypothetical protein